MSDVPVTRYARLGDDRIAYQVTGEGELDLLFVPALTSSIDAQWDWPACAQFNRHLASFSRLIMFDHRGFGASDPVSLESLPIWEEWADDARAVLDAAESERAAIIAGSSAGPVATLFAAAQRERTRALILATTSARFMSGDGYELGMAPEDAAAAVTTLEAVWGTEDAAWLTAPEAAEDPAYRRWSARSERTACSPREWAAYLRQLQRTDVRSVLPTIRVPTLVLHRESTPWMTVDEGRYLAEHIPGASFAVVPGRSIYINVEPYDEALDHIRRFLVGNKPLADQDRVLAAVLFTDMVSSTERAAALGDRRWRALLESHDALARTIVDQHRGRLVKMTGDGVLATFDGPGRAIRSAFALREALHSIGIEIRAGLHTGEVEFRGQDIGGIGVHVAARVLEHAGPDEVLVSGAIPMLVAGSGLEFEDRGEHELRGIPGPWRLYAVQA